MRTKKKWVISLTLVGFLLFGVWSPKAVLADGPVMVEVDKGQGETGGEQLAPLQAPPPAPAPDQRLAGGPDDQAKGSWLGRLWNKVKDTANRVTGAVSTWMDQHPYIKGLAVGVGKALAWVAAGAAVVAVAVAAGVAAPVILGVGLGLLAVGAGVGFYSRYQEQKRLGMQPSLLKTGLVALGDVVGVSGIIEGATKQRLLTSQQLSDYEAGEAMGGGVIQLATVLLGLKAAKSVPRGGEPGPAPGPKLGSLLADEGGYMRLGGEASPEATLKPNEILVERYGTLKNRTDIPGQAHHLNQDAAFGKAVPKNEGVSIKLEGQAFSEPGTPHYEAHAKLEQFWNQFRKGGARFGERPTNLEYTRALADSLRAAGLSEAEVRQAVAQAIAQRVDYGLLGGEPVPNLPKRINQVKP